MNKLSLLFNSRTFWTLLVGFVFNAIVPALNLSPELRDTVNGIIVIVAGYFHVNPSQNYTQPPQV